MKKVRLQSTTTDNIVSYTVVIEVANPDGKLLPGMTASVDFITGDARNVLTVPNAALRFRPTEAMIASVRAQPGGAGQGREGAHKSPDTAVLWYLDAAGKPVRARVHTGLTDGQRTEVSGQGLEPGREVIIGVTQASTGAAATNPFQSQPMGGSRRF